MSKTILEEAVNRGDLQCGAEELVKLVPEITIEHALRIVQSQYYFNKVIAVCLISAAITEVRKKGGSVVERKGLPLSPDDFEFLKEISHRDDKLIPLESLDRAIKIVSQCK